MPNKKKRVPKSPSNQDQVLYRPEAPSNTKSKIYFKDKKYYFNVHVRRWKKHIDGHWDNGPLIYKVPLYPEQAVLSCCATGDEAVRLNAGSTICQLGGVGSGVGCAVSNSVKGQRCTPDAQNQGDGPATNGSS